MSEALIRPERPEDLLAIARVHEIAFQSLPHSQQTERFIVQALRQADALTVSLVAERSGLVVGHVAFSPVECSDGATDWYGLGPVAVLPEHQRQGLGQALIDAGLAGLRGLGAAGCVVLGAPGYYGRFGFRHHPECALAGVPPEFFQTISFGSSIPTGTVTYHAAFQVTR